MGRSNTAPLDPKPQRNGTFKKPSRSATTPQEPPVAKSHHPHLKLPHPHLPNFHHGHHGNEPTPPPSSRPSHDPPRPGLPQRQNSVQTRYMTMLLNLDDIPRLHNILAAFFTWVLLAGFLILPGTFTTITKKIDEDSSQSETANQILSSIKHVQLLVVGGVCSGIGALGMVWLWYRWRRNYVWLLNRIFLPGCLNSLAGLISTLIGVYGQQDGNWSVTARVTAAVTGGVMIVTGVLFTIYNFAVLARVKKSHTKEMEGAHENETVLEKVQRQANEPALEPGSVV